VVKMLYLVIVVILGVINTLAGANNGFAPSYPSSQTTTAVTSDVDRQRLYTQAMKEHNTQQQVSGIERNPFPAQPPPQLFHAVESMTRERVLEYIGSVLRQLCQENDKLVRRMTDKASDSVKISLSRRGGVRIDNSQEQLSAAGRSPVDAIRTGSLELKTAPDTIETLIRKLSSSSLEVSNLTLIISLVYLDRVASELHVYCNTETVLKLFGGCLMVASKMHRNETSREQLAESLEVPISNLLEVESSITESVRDLSVQPQTLAAYVRPLVQIGANQLEAPPR